MEEQIRIEKLVHGGQGIGTLADGRRVFVWNALPGELVRVRLGKSKRSYAEAIAEEVIEASPDRVAPREEIYLSTSPWQILPLQRENEHKTEIVQELFAQQHVVLPEFTTQSHGNDWQYRNKMEYSFWGDDDGLHLALHQRGSHGKYIVEGSALALPAVDAAARGVAATLGKLPHLRAGDLKTIMVRSTAGGKVVGALFVKREDFYKIELPADIAGLKVYYSNPKSPASVTTKLLYELGDTELTDEILGTSLKYDVTGFFQVNLPVFEQTMHVIDEWTRDDKAIVDMYSGVGSIGIPLKRTSTLVELDPHSVAMARENTKDIEVVHASTERALEYITSDGVIVVDPPRSGLHHDVIDRILDARPRKIVYLSCNPATQARDIALLAEAYDIKGFQSFNFFPHTPHIETLALLELR